MTLANNSSSSLTSFSPASLREVITISVPIMISSLSGLTMNFFDRLILANYSISSMNAAVTAGMTANIFTYGALGIALIAEVFVGKKNGEGDFKNAARPVWQMLWFSFATTLVFLPTALFLSPYLVPTEAFSGQAVEYFKIWMLFGPVFPMVGALSAFFIGTGKVKTVTVVALLGNALNIAIDYLLVFGFKGIPSMGVSGAAIASGLAQTIQMIILGMIFLHSANHKRFSTRSFCFDKKLFIECIKIGGPNTIGHMIEILAWSVILGLMTMAGEVYITVMAIGQSLFMLFAFVTDGLQKAVTTIAANLIGAKNQALIKKLLFSTMTFLWIILLIFFIPLAIYPDPIVNLFLFKEFSGNSDLYYFARSTGIWVWLYLLLDGSVWIFAGVLTAFSDTKFIMVANALAAWSFCLVPTYIAINIFGAPAYFTWVIMNIYALINVSMFILRAKYIFKKNVLISGRIATLP